MFATLAAAMLVALGGASQRQTDTTIAVPAGASLSVNNFGGGITVHGWSENRVKVHAETGRRGRVEVSLVGNTVVVKASSREGAPSVMDFDITVPQSMALSLSGTYADITVDGVQGPISAETVNGEVNVSGEIKLETTNGNVMMMGIQSSSVDAGTINGDVVYEGTVKDGGSYSFGSHNGDISVSIPEGANVTVTTATANGDIDASFALPLTSTTGKHRKTFKIGSGSARMELESFQGDIEMRRPQELRDRIDRKHKHDENENDNDHDSDFDFDFHFDDSAIATAVSNAADYAVKYAKEYAPRYARQYARTYSRKYWHTPKWTTH